MWKTSASAATMDCWVCWENITQRGAMGKTAFKSKVPPMAWGAWEVFTVCEQVHPITPGETHPVLWPDCDDRPR